MIGGFDPLYSAIRDQNKKAVEILLANGAIVPSNFLGKIYRKGLQELGIVIEDKKNKTKGNFMNSSTITSNSTTPLWSQRSKSVNDDIDHSFEKLVKQSTSGWGTFNGSSDYTILGVDEQVLMKRIIKEAPKEQKEFYVLDIGAGNFQWSKSLADYLDKQTDLPEDIKIHIIGVRGESYFGDRIVETNRCKIYNLGAFKVEELFEQFKKEGLNLQNNVDLAISSWCFRHLNDPVGTFAQTYDLLRPKSGIFLFDGFFYLTQQDNWGTDGAETAS